MRYHFVIQHAVLQDVSVLPERQHPPQLHLCLVFPPRLHTSWSTLGDGGGMAATFKMTESLSVFLLFTQPLYFYLLSMTKHASWPHTHWSLWGLKMMTFSFWFHSVKLILEEHFTAASTCTREYSTIISPLFGTFVETFSVVFSFFLTPQSVSTKLMACRLSTTGNKKTEKKRGKTQTFPQIPWTELVTLK